MKKFILIAAVAATALASCDKGTNMKPVLSNEVDTLSYELGMAQSQEVPNYMMQQGVDSAFVEEFLEGVKEGVLNAADKKKLAHYLGVMYGINSHMQMEGLENYAWADSITKLSRHDFLAGLYNGVNHKSNMALNGKALAPEDCYEEIRTRVEVLHSTRYEEYKKEQAKLFEEYAQQDGVKRLENGVCYKVLTQSPDTTKIQPESYVNLYYELKLMDGTLIESNYDAEPAMFTPMGTIPGFGEALTKMSVGSEWEIVIPAELAYGDMDQGAIKPGSVLKFRTKIVSTQGN